METCGVCETQNRDGANSRETLSDEAAVRAVLEGARDTFGILVRRYVPSVRAVALSRTGNASDADDVVQETFIRAYLYLGTLKDGQHFGSWVMVIAKNVARNLLAQRCRRDDVVQQLSATERSVAPEVERRDLRAFVLDQVNRLDTSHRDALLLHYFSGMSVLEVASAQGVSEEAAKKRLQRARATLRTIGKTCRASVG